MASWAEFEAAEPALARRVGALFRAHRHHTMATLRRDGAPRLSGTEVEIVEGDLVLGMMAGARRAGDLRRDPRLALHTHTSDPPPEQDDPSSWVGDAKVSGTAHERAPAPGDDGAHRFRIELQEVVLTCVGTPSDHLVIEVWRPGRGVERIERR